MDIAQYLADLLIDNDEVGIPGLGTIYKEKISAKFNEQTGTFDPPAFLLKFSERISPDTRLNEHISKTKNISLSSAEFFAGRFSEEIRQKLETDSKAELSSLGWLEKIGDHIHLHSPDRFSDTGNFGLKPVTELSMDDFPAPEPTIQPAAVPEDEPAAGNEEEDRPDYDRQAMNETDDLPGDEEDYAPAVHQTEEIETPLFDKIVLRENTAWDGESVDTGNEEATPARRRKWVLTAVLLFMLAGAAAFAYLFQNQLTDLYKKIVSDLSETPPPAKPVPAKSLIITPAAKDSLPDSLVTRDSIVPDTPAKMQPVKKVAATAPTSAVYIILDSFTTMKEAQDFQNSMRARSIETIIVDKTDGLIKVSTTDSYKDFSDADADLKRIQRSISPRALPMIIYH